MALSLFFCLSPFFSNFFRPNFFSRSRFLWLFRFVMRSFSWWFIHQIFKKKRHWANPSILVNNGQVSFNFIRYRIELSWFFIRIPLIGAWGSFYRVFFVTGFFFFLASLLPAIFLQPTKGAVMFFFLFHFFFQWNSFLEPVMVGGLAMASFSIFWSFFCIFWVADGSNLSSRQNETEKSKKKTKKNKRNKKKHRTQRVQGPTQCTQRKTKHLYKNNSFIFL